MNELMNVNLTVYFLQDWQTLHRSAGAFALQVYGYFRQEAKCATIQNLFAFKGLKPVTWHIWGPW